jgi:hypothetical protein
MAYRAWICESCYKGSRIECPWSCPGCSIEVCDNCGWMFNHCKKCCEGKTEDELKEAAKRAGFDL